MNNDNLAPEDDQNDNTVEIEPTLLSLIPFPAVLQFAEPGETASLSVTGLYSDGATSDLTSAASGTVYQSTNASVATASEDGLVTAVGFGQAQITIANSEVTTVVAVVVQALAPPPDNDNVGDEIDETGGNDNADDTGSGGGGGGPQAPSLVQLSLSFDSLIFTETIQRAQLQVTGIYSNGTQVDLTDPANGTEYLTDDPDIASVSVAGLVAPIARGDAIITVVNGDVTATTSVDVQFCRPPSPTIDAHPASTAGLRITLSGVAEANAQVEIVNPLNDVVLVSAAADGSYTGTVPLDINGANQIFVTTIADCGARSSPATTFVTMDIEPPTLFIDFPLPDSEIEAESTDVIGRVSDILSGYEGLTVEVNGLPATVDVGIGTNGTFFLPGYPLVAGSPTTITAMAIDAQANFATVSTTVTRLEIPDDAPRMEIVSGDGQAAPVHDWLVDPIVVRMTKADGTPFIDKVVTFEVTRSDGGLAARGGIDGTMMFQTHTDEEGYAQAFWRLGGDAGMGNNRVSVTSRDIAGTVSFSVSGVPRPAAQINVGAGNNQRIETGGQTLQPLRAWVSDSCNGIEGLAVTFTVTRGAGKVNGLDSVTVTTGATGHAEVDFNAGPDVGNNWIEADFEGNPHGPATFVAYGVARDETQPATYSGTIFDNTSQPLGGAGVRVEVSGIEAGTVVSGDNGSFTIEFADATLAGAADLYVDADTINKVGGNGLPAGIRFPDMHFETSVVPNGANSLGMTIKLPRLNTVNDRIYDGEQSGDLELTCEGMDGLKMVVRAGTTITLPDGTRVGPTDPGQVTLSLNQVHHDDVPMPMPDGAAPPFAWTFQPAGSTFDIPVYIEYPNMSGLPAGTVANFLSFNHATNKFEIVATGSVSADGSTIISDPGSGITTSGWGCNCPPYSVTGTCDSEGDDDDDDNDCSGADCEEDNGGCDEHGAGESSECKKENGGSCGNGETDPVNLFSGEFVWDEEDLRVPGRGFDFAWKRTYRSRTREFTDASNGTLKIAKPTSALGVNWDFSYNIFLVLKGSALELHDGTGRIDLYAKNSDGTWGRAEFFRAIVLNADGTYTLTHPDQRKLTFAQVGAASVYYVTSIIDRNGNTMAFEYDADGRLSTIHDTLDRSYALEYDDFGRLSALEDYAGRRVEYRYSDLALLTYNYFVDELDCSALGVEVTVSAEAPGDLVSATTPSVSGTPNGNDYPDGKTTEYIYADTTLNEQSNHNIVGIVDRKGREIVRNEYSLSSAVLANGSQWYGFDEFYLLNPGVCDKSEPFLCDMFSLGVTGLNSDLFCEEMTLPMQTKAEQIISQQWGDDDDVTVMTYGATVPVAGNNHSSRRTTVNDREGHVLQYFYDSQNRLTMKREYTGRSTPGQAVSIEADVNAPIDPLRADDPAYYETRWSFTADGNVAQIIHPNGNETDYVYEAALDPDAPRAAQGNVREIHHKPGTHTPAGDQAEITENLEYDEGMGSCCGGFNFVTRYVDGRGNEIRNEYDDRGNRTKLIHAIPSITEDWEYNEFGQVTAHVLPDNGSGHQRRDEYVYYTETDDDQNGYLKSEIIDAAGLNLTTTYEYDAVGNVVRKIDPKGNDSQYVINALNQVVREISRDVGGGVRYSKDFYYDANDNLVRIDVLNVDENGAVRGNAYLTTVLEYETLNHMTRMCRESGEYTGEIPGTPESPTCDGLPQSEFVITEFEYDAVRNRTLMRSPEAVAGSQPTNTTRIVYDERNLTYQIIRGEGTADQSTTQFDYDPNGNLVALTSGLEGTLHTTTWTYDGYNRQVAITDPMGNVTEPNYDEASNVIHTLVTGELLDGPEVGEAVRLVERNYFYDATNRRTRMESAFFEAETQAAIGDGVVATDVAYADTSRVSTVTNDNGHALTYAYDSANRQRTISDAKGNTSTLDYDANSNVIAVAEVEKSDLGMPDEAFVTTMTYDGLDRRVQVVDNVGNTSQFGYDSRHNEVVTTDAKGNVVRREHDGLDRLLRTIHEMRSTGDGSGDVIDPIVTSMTWDDNSRMTSRTDDNGHTTTHAYDPLDRLIAETMADGTQSLFAYDVRGNRVTSTDANGTVVHSEYDLADRITGTTIEPAAGVLGTTFELFEYDGLSRLVRAADDDSEVIRTYDSMSNVILETQNGATVSAAYDGVDNMLSCTYPGGRTITATFDELERKRTVADEVATIATYSFVGPQRVAQRDFANNTRLTYAYDGVRRKLATTHVLDPDGVAEMIEGRAYAWDAKDNKTDMNDVRPGGPGRSYDFAYDSADRLINTQVRDALGAVERDTAYLLDGVHNRTSVTGTPDDGDYVGAYTMQQGDPAHDFEVNQYTSTPFDQRSYDANGNLCESSAVDGTDAYAYDFRNRMVEFVDGQTNVRSTYAYDVLGRRIEKIVDADGPMPETTRFFYQAWREIEERDDAGTTQATYTYGHYIDEILTMQRGGQEYHYHGDDLFNVRAVTDASGTVVERYDYGDYGQPTIMDGTGQPLIHSVIGNPFLFNGRRYDEESGLYDYRTRYLDPIAGRFTVRDPLGAWGDAAHWGNGYAFVGNNPYRLVDPYGLQGCHQRIGPYANPSVHGEPERNYYEEAMADATIQLLEDMYKDVKTVMKTCAAVERIGSKLGPPGALAAGVGGAAVGAVEVVLEDCAESKGCTEFANEFFDKLDDIADLLDNLEDPTLTDQPHFIEDLTAELDKTLVDGAPVTGATTEPPITELSPTLPQGDPPPRQLPSPPPTPDVEPDYEDPDVRRWSVDEGAANTPEQRREMAELYYYKEYGHWPPGEEASDDECVFSDGDN